MLLEGDRENVKLAFVETVRRDCSDMADMDRCRPRLSYGFFEWESARCGITGASDRAGGCGVFTGAVKRADRWFGSADRDLLGDDSTSGLVGGVVPFVTPLSDMSSSDLCEEPVEGAVMGWMSGALYDSILVVWMSSIGFEILWRIEPTDPFIEVLRW